MAARKSEQRLRWERYLRIRNGRHKPVSRFLYLKSDNSPQYGRWMKFRSETELHIATIQLTVDYLRIKALLRVIGGVDLSPPMWKVKQPEHWTTKIGPEHGWFTVEAGTVAWKAVAEEALTNEAKRKIALNRKRARRVSKYV